MSINRIDLAPVFRRAAEIIKANGHHQGDYIPDPFGRVLTVPAAERPMSAVAALRCAEMGHPQRFGPLSSAAIEVLADRLLVDDEPPFGRSELMLECHVAAWGDVLGRTAVEVVAELVGAAEAVERAFAGELAEQRHQVLDAAVPPLACEMPRSAVAA